MRVRRTCAKNTRGDPGISRSARPANVHARDLRMIWECVGDRPPRALTRPFECLNRTDQSRVLTGAAAAITPSRTARSQRLALTAICSARTRLIRSSPENLPDSPTSVDGTRRRRPQRVGEPAGDDRRRNFRCPRECRHCPISVRIHPARSPPSSRFAGSTTCSTSWASTSATAIDDTIAATKQGSASISACHPRLMCGARRGKSFPRRLLRNPFSAHFSSVAPPPRPRVPYDGGSTVRPFTPSSMTRRTCADAV